MFFQPPECKYQWLTCGDCYEKLNPFVVHGTGLAVNWFCTVGDSAPDRMTGWHLLGWGVGWS